MAARPRRTIDVPLPKFLQAIGSFFGIMFRGKPAPPPAPQPVPPVPAANALTPLMQRVAEVQGVQTKEAYDTKRRFRNAFHEAGHSIVAHARGETVDEIDIDPPSHRPFARITRNIEDKLDLQIRQGPACSPQILATLETWLDIVVAGVLQETEADRERKPISSDIDWTKYPRSGSEDRDRIIEKMRDAGFEGRTDLVRQAEQRVKALIAGKRAKYEALVSYLDQHGRIEKSDVQNYL